MSFYKINPLKINWESEDSCLFFNEKHKQKGFFVSYIPHLPRLKSHIWLATSGRVHQKWVALSKKALLTSSQAVNQHLFVTSKDRWGICLPLFHVGGLSILARAYLSHSSCFPYHQKWSAKSFVVFLNNHKITLSSLVPTQVYDLVKENLTCPPFVRAIVVGGENLSKNLYQAARSLNWPLLPSYGLTECGSQVATAQISSLNTKEFPLMTILPHIGLKIVHQEIVIQSESLLSGFMPLFASLQSKFQDPKEDGWYFTGDKGSLQEHFLQINKLSVDQIKIMGEKVSLSLLEEELMNILLKKAVSGRCFLLSIPNEREGFQMALISDIFDRQILSDIIWEFNANVSPFERIRQFYFVSSLPLSGISKISKPVLLKKLGFS